ncbi:MAG: hypothetical protein IPN33_25370 [Saprospiraceae bacterium]|nr:hypothetical protein [Saprospiraceae bacterium]
MDLAASDSIAQTRGSKVMDIKTGVKCQVVEYQSGSLPITLDALPEDIAQGEKDGKVVGAGHEQIQEGRQGYTQTAALGRGRILGN